MDPRLAIIQRAGQGSQGLGVQTSPVYQQRFGQPQRPTAIPPREQQIRSYFDQAREYERSAGRLSAPQQNAGGMGGALGAVLGNPIVSNILEPLAILDIPRRFVATTVKESLDAFNGQGFSTDDWSAQFNDASFGFGDIAPQTGNKWLDRAIGFVGDVALDPLTYVTLGTGKFASLSGRSALAAKAAEMGWAADDIARLGKYGPNVMDNAKRLDLGLAEHGLRFGSTSGGKSWRIPGTGALAENVGGTLAKGRAGLANTKLGGRLRGIRADKDLKEILDTLATGRGNVVAAADSFGARQSEKAARNLFTNTFRQRGADAVTGFDDNLASSVIHNVESGVKGDSEDGLRDFFKVVREDVEARGIEIGDLGDRYVPHILTADAKRLGQDGQMGEQLRKVFFTSDANDAPGSVRARNIKPGETIEIGGKKITFEGDGKIVTIDEINKKMTEAFPEAGVTKWVEDDARIIVADYLEQMGDAVGKRASFDRLLGSKSGLANTNKGASTKSSINAEATQAQFDEFDAAVKAADDEATAAGKAKRAEAYKSAEEAKREAASVLSERIKGLTGVTKEQKERLAQLVKDAPTLDAKIAEMERAVRVLTPYYERQIAIARRQLDAPPPVWDDALSAAANKQRLEVYNAAAKKRQAAVAKLEAEQKSFLEAVENVRGARRSTADIEAKFAAADQEVAAAKAARQQAEADSVPLEVSKSKNPELHWAVTEPKVKQVKGVGKSNLRVRASNLQSEGNDVRAALDDASVWVGERGVAHRDAAREAYEAARKEMDDAAEVFGRGQVPTAGDRLNAAMIDVERWSEFILRYETAVAAGATPSESLALRITREVLASQRASLDEELKAATVAARASSESAEASQKELQRLLGEKAKLDRLKRPGKKRMAELEQQIEAQQAVVKAALASTPEGKRIVAMAERLIEEFDSLNRTYDQVNDLTRDISVPNPRKRELQGQAAELKKQIDALDGEWLNPNLSQREREAIFTRLTDRTITPQERARLERELFNPDVTPARARALKARSTKLKDQRRDLLANARTKTTREPLSVEQEVLQRREKIASLEKYRDDVAIPRVEQIKNAEVAGGSAPGGMTPGNDPIWEASKAAAKSTTTEIRTNTLRSLSAGTVTLADVFATELGLVRGMRLENVLAAMPDMGRVRAERILKELGISSPTVGSIGKKQRIALFDYLKAEGFDTGDLRPPLPRGAGEQRTRELATAEATVKRYNERIAEQQRLIDDAEKSGKSLERRQRDEMFESVTDFSAEQVERLQDVLDDLGTRDVMSLYGFRNTSAEVEAQVEAALRKGDLRRVAALSEANGGGSEITEWAVKRWGRERGNRLNRELDETDYALLDAYGRNAPSMSNSGFLQAMEASVDDAGVVSGVQLVDQVTKNAADMRLRDFEESLLGFGQAIGLKIKGKGDIAERPVRTAREVVRALGLPAGKNKAIDSAAVADFANSIMSNSALRDQFGGARAASAPMSKAARAASESLDLLGFGTRGKGAAKVDWESAMRLGKPKATGEARPVAGRMRPNPRYSELEQELAEAQARDAAAKAPARKVEPQRDAQQVEAASLERSMAAAREEVDAARAAVEADAASKQILEENQQANLFAQIELDKARKELDALPEGAPERAAIEERITQYQALLDEAPTTDLLDDLKRAQQRVAAVEAQQSALAKAMERGTEAPVAQVADDAAEATVEATGRSAAEIRAELAKTSKMTDEDEVLTVAASNKMKSMRDRITRLKNSRRITEGKVSRLRAERDAITIELNAARRKGQGVSTLEKRLEQANAAIDEAVDAVNKIDDESTALIRQLKDDENRYGITTRSIDTDKRGVVDLEEQQAKAWARETEAEAAREPIAERAYKAREDVAAAKQGMPQRSERRGRTDPLRQIIANADNEMAATSEPITAATVKAQQDKVTSAKITDLERRQGELKATRDELGERGTPSVPTRSIRDAEKRVADLERQLDETWSGVKGRQPLKTTVHDGAGHPEEIVAREQQRLEALRAKGGKRRTKGAANAAREAEEQRLASELAAARSELEGLRSGAEGGGQGRSGLRGERAALDDAMLDAQYQIEQAQGDLVRAQAVSKNLKGSGGKKKAAAEPIDKLIADAEAVLALAPDDPAMAKVASLLASAAKQTAEAVGLEDAAAARRLEAAAKRGELAPLLKMSLRDDFEQIGKELGADIAVHRDVARFMTNITKASDDGELWKMFDKYTQFFKTWATATPGFHLRNAMSATFMNYADGVRPTYMIEAMKIWSAFKRNPEGYIKSLTAAEQERIGQALLATFGSGAGGAYSAAELGKVGTAGRLTNNTVTRLSRRMGERVEGAVRLAAALDTMSQKGATWEEAMMRVQRLHFDYSEVSDFDKMAKRVIPFWTFMSRNLPLQIQQMWTRPKAYLQYQSFVRNFGQDYKDEDGVPLSWREMGAFKIGSKAWGGDDIFLAPELQHVRLKQDVAKLTDPVRLLADANPLVKLPAELLAGRKFFNNERFRENDFEALDAELLPFQPLLAAIGMTETAGNGQTVVDARAAHVIRNLIPFLSQIQRQFPSDDYYNDRLGQSRLAYAGIPVKRLTERTADNERRRRNFDSDEERQNARLKALAAFSN